MKKCVASIASVLLTLTAFSQEGDADSSMAYAEIMDGYIHIPKSALDDKFDAVLIIVKDSQTDSYGKKGIEFWWGSLCNDGYYNLTITPK